MKIKKTSYFNIKTFLYLSLVGVLLSFSAFSCEVYAPLEIRIENKTGYDLKAIEANDIEIASLKNGETSKYISTEEFAYLRSVYATVNQKSERRLMSPNRQIYEECGTMWGYGETPPKPKNILISGKHTFILSVYKDGDTERLSFEKK